MIEQSTKENFPRLVEIWESAVIATHHFLSKDDFMFFKVCMPNFLEGISLYHYVNDSDVVSGFLGVDDDNIAMLFIHDTERNKGIGKLLVQYAINELKCSKVDVNEQNTQAVGFYKHMGFKELCRDEVDGLGKPYPILHMAL